MPPQQLLALLPLVELPRAKRDLLAIIGALEGGRWVDSGDAAHEVGLSEGRCRVLLAQLATAKVILRDSGGGGRRFWCEINPDVLAWKVEWRVAKRELVDRLARHTVQVRLGPIRRFIARPMWARCAAASARLWTARSEVDEDANALVAPDPPSTPSRGKKSARSHRHLSVVHERAVIAGSPERGVSGARSSRDAEADPSHAGGFADEEESKSQLKRAKAAVFARTLTPPGGGRWLNGRPKDQLVELIAEHGIDAVVDATLRVEAGRYMPPQFVDRIDGELAGLLDDRDAAVAAERRQALTQRVTSLRNQADTYRRAGVDDDDDQMAVIMGEIAECENALQALDAEGAG